MKSLRVTRTRKAFTLVELMVVIMIIAVLAAMVVPRLISRTEQANEAKAIADLTNMYKMLQTYRIDVGEYPTNEEGLNGLFESNVDGWKGPYLEGTLPVDPWGMDYIYEFPGDTGEDSFYIYSSGPDKQEGTEDDIYY